MRRINLRLMACAALCGLLGFAAARLIGIGPPAEQRHSAAPASVELAGHSSATGPLPSAAGKPGSSAILPRPEFTNVQGFRAYVTRLERELGVDEKFAQWLALTLLAKSNFDAAFQIARSEKLINVWSSGAAVLDPRAAIALVRGLPMQESEGALFGLFEALGCVDPKGGLALLGGLAPADASDVAFQFFQRWAGSSLPAAMEAAARMQPRSVRDRSLAGVFHVWGLTDRREMMEWAAGQDASVGRSAFRSSYESVGVRDPDEVLELAQEYPKSVDWLMIAEIARGLAMRGTEGWESVSRLPPGALRNEVMLRVGEDMAQTDPKGAWKFAQTLPPEDMHYFLRLSNYMLARVAPREMADLAIDVRQGWPASPVSIINTWSETDAPGALAWTDAHLHGRVKMDALQNIFQQWAKTDAAAATGALENLTPAVRASLLPNLAQAWAFTDPAAAMAWAKSRPPLDRMQAFYAVMQGWSDKDPMAAAKMLQGASPEESYPILDTVAGNLARSQPAYAVQWAENLGNAGARNQAIEEVASVWGSQDASSTADYLAKMQPGDYRDSAVKGFVQSIARLDPPTAVEWAATIQKDSARRAGMRSALLGWQDKDAAAAHAYVDGMKPGPLKDDLQRLFEK